MEDEQKDLHYVDKYICCTRLGRRPQKTDHELHFEGRTFYPATAEDLAKKSFKKKYLTCVRTGQRITLYM